MSHYHNLYHYSVCRLNLLCSYYDCSVYRCGAAGLLLCLSHTHGDNAEAMGEPHRPGPHVSLNLLILVTICLASVSSSTICPTAGPSAGLGLSMGVC